MTETARLRLPLIEPGQAQKELFHNEALLLIDAAVQAVVAGVGLDAPPDGERTAGACHALGAAPAGEWAGHPFAIAAWTAGGWRFVPTREGAAVWDRTSAMLARRTHDGWQTGVRIAGPAGGTTIDTEARATLQAILDLVRMHGLVAP